jgi:hypothetical protein
MNIQEQEHWDYEDGCMSELQNAYDQSRMEIDLVGDINKITELLNKGKSLVVSWHTVYCPRTDAYLGDVAHIEHVCANLETANAVFRHMVDVLGLDDIEIRTPGDKTISQNCPTEVCDSDIPF